MAKQEIDPWLDEETKVDFTPHAEDRQMVAEAGPTAADAPQFDAKDFELDEEPTGSLKDFLKTQAPEQVVDEEPAPAATTPAPAPEPDQPETIDLGNGAKGTIEKSKKGWKATLDTGIDGTNPEVFYGSTKEEMYRNLMSAKVHATRKIREQERRIMLEAPVEPAEPKAPEAPRLREMTADDIFAIKTALESNPALAMEKWFQLRTGMTLEQLLVMNQKAEKGALAASELDSESVARGFRAAHPEYYNTDLNRDTLIGYLTKQKLRVTMTPENAEQLFNRLADEGHWTVKNLSEAYEALSSRGFLETEPTAEPEEVEEVEPVSKPVATAAAPAPTPTPAPAAEPIARTVRRPRAALGLPANAGSGQPKQDDPRAPSAEDLDNLSDHDLNALFAGVRRARLTSRR